MQISVSTDLKMGKGNFPLSQLSFTQPNLRAMIETENFKKYLFTQCITEQENISETRRKSH